MPLIVHVPFWSETRAHFSYGETSWTPKVRRNDPAGLPPAKAAAFMWIADGAVVCECCITAPEWRRGQLVPIIGGRCSRCGRVVR